jgi:hypothetical protein
LQIQGLHADKHLTVVAPRRRLLLAVPAKIGSLGKKYGRQAPAALNPESSGSPTEGDLVRRTIPPLESPPGVMGLGAGDVQSRLAGGSAGGIAHGTRYSLYPGKTKRPRPRQRSRYRGQAAEAQKGCTLPGTPARSSVLGATVTRLALDTWREISAVRQGPGQRHSGKARRAVHTTDWPAVHVRQPAEQCGATRHS